MATENGWELRASSYGGCIKGQIAGKLGYKPLEPSETMQGYFDRGHIHEEECREALVRDGWTIRNMQKEVVICGVPGHIDGTIDAEDQPLRLWEAKAPTAWEAFERAVRGGTVTPLAEKYLWQISHYMAATGLEAMVSCVEDGRVKSFVIEVPPKSWDEILGRVTIIQEATTLPATCTSDDYPCPWVYLHEAKTRPDHDLITDMLLMDYAQATEAVKVVKGKILGRVGEGNYDSDLGKVTHYSIQGKRTVDYRALEADGILDKYVRVGEAGSGVRITPRMPDTETAETTETREER